MRFTELAIRGAWLIDAELHGDERGLFRRHFCQDEFRSRGIDSRIVQGNVSENRLQGTLRGFHFQVRPGEEAKTLSCMSGSLYDIVLDLRPNSPTFKTWVSVELSSSGRNSLHVPAGCANAWITLEDSTSVHYYMSTSYAPSLERGIQFNDPAFNFSWPMAPRVLSDKDRAYPDFHPDRPMREA